MTDSAKFKGTKEDFLTFERNHKQDLAIEKIGYFHNEAELTRQITGPAEPVPSTLATAEARKLQNDNRQKIYFDDRKAWMSRLEDVKKDAYAAIGILRKRLPLNVSQAIDRFLRDDIAGEPWEKYRNAWNHLVASYAPSSISDVDLVKKELRELNDSFGYKHVFHRIDMVQEQLRRIPRRDAVTGLPVADGDEYNRTFIMRPEELSSYLMDILARATNDRFKDIHRDALINRWTYEQIRDFSMTLLLANCALYDPLSVNYDPETVDTKHAKAFRAAAVKQAPYANNNQATSSNTVNFIMTKSGNRVECRNCGENHYVLDCPKTKCYTCDIDFPSVTARRAHAAVKHKGRNAARGRDATKDNRGKDKKFGKPDVSRSRSRDRADNNKHGQDRSKSPAHSKKNVSFKADKVRDVDANTKAIRQSAQALIALSSGAGDILRKELEKRESRAVGGRRSDDGNETD
jgi:hypothetical protein